MEDEIKTVVFDNTRWPSGKTVSSGHLFIPKETPKGIVYFWHGLTEYGTRHWMFCSQLSAAGYAVIAEDLFDKCDADRDYSDILYHSLLCIGQGRSELRSIFGEYVNKLPVYGVGFSFGSYLVLGLSAWAKFKKIVLIGSGEVAPYKLRVGKIIAEALSLIKKKDLAEKLVQKVFFSGYNKAVHEKRPFGWLLSDEDALQEYLNDSRCDKKVTPQIMYALLDGMESSNSGLKKYPLRVDDVLVLSGEYDAVGGFGRNVDRLCLSVLRHPVSCKKIVYAGARHNVLEETCCKKQVASDIIKFLEK